MPIHRQGHARKRTLDAFTRGYVTCALWSTTDNSTPQGGEPLDKNYGIKDIAAKTLLQMARDCRAFQKDNAKDLKASGLSDSRAGHDFWLNREGHGSGFWDEGLGALGERLSKAAKAYGTYDLYVGDDGKVHGS